MKGNTMRLLQRMKGWLLPNSSRDVPVADLPASHGTAVAGFVQRIAADVEIVAAPNMALAVLMPPAVAAATPLRTIPLFLVSNTAEAAEVEIVQNVRPAPKLLLVHNADRASAASAPAADFLLAARLASVARLNPVAGRKPAVKAPRISTQTSAKNQAKAANRPCRKPEASEKQATKFAAAKSAATKNQCFVRPQATGTAAVVSVPKRAKRRAA
jgi:hypothetical protein